MTKPKPQICEVKIGSEGQAVSLDEAAAQGQPDRGRGSARAFSCMNTNPVQQDMLNLMDALSGAIIRTEAMAEELTRAASALSGHRLGAKAIRDTAMRQRVRAIELRSQLAALRQEFAERFPLKL